MVAIINMTNATATTRRMESIRVHVSEARIIFLNLPFSAYNEDCLRDSQVETQRAWSRSIHDRGVFVPATVTWQDRILLDFCKVR
jgi:hypothetical protein